MSNKHKRALAYLYEFRDSPAEPPDPRVSLSGVVKALEVPAEEVLEVMEELKEHAYIRSWKVGRSSFYKLTSIGTAEMEKQTERWVKGEIGTSGIGLGLGQRTVNG